MIKLFSLLTILSLLSQPIHFFEHKNVGQSGNSSSFSLDNGAAHGDNFFRGDQISFDLKIKGMNLVFRDLLNYKIIAFTPEGEILNLKSGSTRNNKQISTFVETDSNIPIKKIGIRINHDEAYYFFLLNPTERVSEVLNIYNANERVVLKRD